MIRSAPFVFVAVSICTGCAASRTKDAHAPATLVPWSAPPLERALSVRDGRSGERLALDALFDRLAQADVVFLGETHLDETTHRTELATYEALLARRDGNVVLALEMFERDVQPALDAYLAGTIDEAAFLAQARPWSNYPTAYRPLVELAKKRGVPVVASNFPTTLRRRMASEGEGVLAALPENERRNAPAKLLPNTPAYWRRVDNAVRGHAGMMGPTPAADDPRLDDTQSLWDNAMGESCARALDEHPGALVLHVNGGFHTEYWDGTARQLSLRKPAAKIATVAIDPSGHPAVDELGGIPRADYVVFAESRARDIDEGAHAVTILRELEYRLHVPAQAPGGALLPLLIWLGDDGSSAREELAEWKQRLGDSCAIAVIEAPYRETQEDLVEGARWFWPDSFSADIGALVQGVERTWGYVLRHHPIDAARVCVAGEGSGATVAVSVALLTGRMDATAVALAPRRFAKIKDFPLPLPELMGADRRPVKSLRVIAAGDDAAWWTDEIAAYNEVEFPSQLATPPSDPWETDRARENEVRAALRLESRPVSTAAMRHYVIADGPRERAWARAVALAHTRATGAQVAILAEPPQSQATEIPLAVHAHDFASERSLPLCPGPFGGTTVITPSADMPADEIERWLALEKDDPIAKKSRFHRLRVATPEGENALPAVLAQLLEKGRKNVLIVPAVFCADGATMRALKTSVREFEDRMTIVWQPGLGGGTSD